jgi:hypothetical protein
MARVSQDASARRRRRRIQGILFSSFGPISMAFPPALSRSLEILPMSEDDGWRPLLLAAAALAFRRGWRLGSRMVA